MTGDAYVTYRITFSSVEAAAEAMEKLRRLGFAVSQESRGDRRVVEAGMSGDEARIDEDLDQALIGIEHDPEISWNAARFTGFTTPRP